MGAESSIASESGVGSCPSFSLRPSNSHGLLLDGSGTKISDGMDGLRHLLCTQ